MERTEVKSLVITITPKDLEVIALVCLKVEGSDRRIAAIKRMRDIVGDMRLVGDDGAPVLRSKAPCSNCGTWSCWNAPLEEVKAPGLKECKEATDVWFDGRNFLG